LHALSRGFSTSGLIHLDLESGARRPPDRFLLTSWPIALLGGDSLGRHCRLRARHSGVYCAVYCFDRARVKTPRSTAAPRRQLIISRPDENSEEVVSSMPSRSISLPTRSSVNSVPDFSGRFRQISRNLFNNALRVEKLPTSCQLLIGNDSRDRYSQQPPRRRRFFSCALIKWNVTSHFGGGINLFNEARRDSSQFPK
jgi:hypothetical protein